MAEYLRDALTRLGFPHLIEKFIDEEFDESSFENLTYETLKDLIPKAGPRQKFWQEYLSVYKTEFNCPGTPSTCTSTISVLSDNDTGLADNTLTPSTSDILLTSDPTPSCSNTDLHVQNLGDISLCSNIEHLLFPLQENIFESALKSANGQIVLAFYKKNNILKDYQRNLLSNAIIQKEFENKKGKFAITTSRFFELTKDIKKAFPSENEGTYYIPYNKFTNSVASGKLWTCYNRIKKRLRMSSSNSDEVTTTSSLPENTNEKISFLRNSLEPFEKIEKYWTETAEYRMSQIQSASFSIQSYMKEYGILKGPQGHLLLARDFEHLYQNHSNNLFMNWPKINHSLIKLAENRKTLAENKEVKKVIESQNDASGFFILPYIFAKSSYRKGEGKRMKLSQDNISRKEEGKRVKLTGDDISKNFILQITNANLVTEELNLIRKNLAKQKKTLQPVIVAVGDITDISTIYIAIDEVIYGVNSLINAVDYCFKSFFALNAKYPEDSSGIWTFIQRAIYHIETKQDKVTTTVSSLIADLQ